MSSVTMTTQSKQVRFLPSQPAASSITSNHGTLLISNPTSATTKRLSSSCQQVLVEELSTTSAHLVIRSCLADSALYPIISGHKCNRVGLVPSSLNADMALTAADYIWRALRPKMEVPGINVCDVQVPKGLIAQVPQVMPGQFVEIEAHAELEEGGLGIVKCEFRSVRPDGSKTQDQWAHCTVLYEDKNVWLEEWSRVDFMIKNQIRTLRQDDSMTKMQRGLAYKTFESFVHYGPKYRGMSEVIFSGFEGMATVEFQTGAEDYCVPYHIDNSCHLSGFLCNALDSEEDCVYVSEGWNGMKMLDPDTLLHGSIKKVTTYVRMLPKPKSIVQGDVYILNGDVVVGMWAGIKFKKLPRRVVNIFLPPPKDM